MYQIKIGETHNKKVSTLGDVLAFLNHRGEDLKSLQVEDITVLRDDLPLNVVRSYSNFGVVQEGSAQAIFEAMFKEIELFYVKPVDKVVLPYEMTRDQWNAVVAVRKAASGDYPCFSPEQYREPCQYDRGTENGQFWEATVSHLCDHLFLTRFGWKHNGPTYSEKSDVSNAHELHVAYALAAGKHVAEWVLADYRGPGEGTLGCTGKPDWFTTLLRVPHLRGAIPAEKLKTLVTLLSWDNAEITSENAGEFIQAMRELHDEPTCNEMDDFLFRRGYLKARELPKPAPQSEREIFSPLADQLRLAMAEAQFVEQVKLTNGRRDRNEISVRQYQYEIAMANRLGSSGFLEYGNRLAKAVADKDVVYLLHVLDGPDDSNTITKRAFKKYVGLKLLGLKAADRTTAIYEFCGYDRRAQSEFERNQQAAAEKAKADRREKEVIKLVESIRYAIPAGGVVNGKEFIDQAIGNGFTEITTTKRGNSQQFWLTNPSTQRSYALLKKNGTVDYAEIAIAHAKAASTETNRQAA